jgi:hypothetical protein
MYLLYVCFCLSVRRVTFSGRIQTHTSTHLNNLFMWFFNRGTQNPGVLNGITEWFICFFPDRSE